MISFYQAGVVFFGCKVFSSAAALDNYVTMMFSAVMYLVVLNFYSCTYKLKFRHVLTLLLAWCDYPICFPILIHGQNIYPFTWDLMLQALAVALVAWIPV